MNNLSLSVLESLKLKALLLLSHEDVEHKQ